MTWWGTDLSRDSFQPKQKSRFIVEMGNGGRLLSVSSVTKPSVSIESKQYQMINHYYNYPGIAKWEPIEIKFVDGSVWGQDVSSINTSVRVGAEDVAPFVLATPGMSQGSLVGAAQAGLASVFEETKKITINKMTSAVLWEMLVASGYTPPSDLQGGGTINGRAGSISSPEKASTIDNSFGEYLYIHQLKPEGTTSNVLRTTETWEIYNPIITKISWGDLSYADDGLVEYTLSITYDWAVHYSGNPNIDR